MHIAVSYDKYYVCDNEIIRVCDWFYDSINNKISSSYDEKKTRQLKCILEKILIVTDKKQIMRILYFVNLCHNNCYK